MNFRTYTNSIWDKKQRETPEEKQLVFPNTHKAIIDEDIFERVQAIRQQRHRMTKSGVSSKFSGLVYCADCGARMQFRAKVSGERNDSFFDCSTHRNERKGGCCGHYIRETVLEQLVLKHVQVVTGYILYHEAYFRKVVTEMRELQSQEEIRVRKNKLERSEKRIAELERLFIKIYEDNAAGRLNDDRYEMLSRTYESEQKQLEEEAKELQEEIEIQEAQNEAVVRFIDKLKGCEIVIDRLDGYILHDLIEGIYVGAPDKSSGHREQRIEIRYNGIGFIPVNELMSAKDGVSEVAP